MLKIFMKHKKTEQSRRVKKKIVLFFSSGMCSMIIIVLYFILLILLHFRSTSVRIERGKCLLRLDIKMIASASANVNNLPLSPSTNVIAFKLSHFQKKFDKHTLCFENNNYNLLKMTELNGREKKMKSECTRLLFHSLLFTLHYRISLSDST